MFSYQLFFMSLPFSLSLSLFIVCLLCLLESRIAFFTLLWTCELSQVIGWSKGRDACPSTFIISAFLLLFNASFQRVLPKEIERVNVKLSVILFLQLRMDSIGTTLRYFWCTVPSTGSGLFFLF
jgi:hypothetical protein